MCFPGAPYGYRYVSKSDTSAAFYEVMEAEAKVVANGVCDLYPTGTQYQRHRSFIE